MDTWIFGALVKIDFTIPSNESWDTSASVSTFNIIAGSLILARIDGVTFIDSFPQFYDIFLNVLYFNLKKYTIAFLKSLALWGQPIKLIQVASKYFIIAWILMKRPCFHQNHSLSFLKGLRSLINWPIQKLSMKHLDQKILFFVEKWIFWCPNISRNLLFLAISKLHDLIYSEV